MKVIAISRIKHNGKYYEKDSEVVGLTEKELKALKESGAVEVKGQTPEKPEKEEPAEPAESTDKQNATQVANLKPNSKMNKNKLVGIGIARKLEIDKTLTKSEIRKIIEKDFEERGEL